MSLTSEWVELFQASAALAANGVEVARHDGEFDSDEVRRVSTGPANVFVATLGVAGTDEGNIIWRMAAFVIASRDGARNVGLSSRGALAEAIVDSVVNALENGTQPASACDSPQRVSAKNLFDSELFEIGVTMWAVSWMQTAPPAANAADTISELLTIHTYFDVDTPADPAIDITNQAQAEADADLGATVTFEHENI